MNEDENKYGPVEQRNGRWQRVVNVLDEYFPNWRQHPHFPPREWIDIVGDQAVVAIRDAAKKLKKLEEQLANQQLRLHELGERVASRDALIRERTDEISRLMQLRGRGAQGALDAEIAAHACTRQSYNSACKTIDDLRAELEAEKQRGKANAQFRLLRDKHWEGSYTKKVVDAVRMISSFKWAEDKLASGGVLLSPDNIRTHSAIKAALALLEDYHTTQHEVWEREQALKKENAALRARPLILPSVSRWHSPLRLNPLNKHGTSPSEAFSLCGTYEAKTPPQATVHKRAAADATAIRAGESLQEGLREIMDESNAMAPFKVRGLLCEYIRALIRLEKLSQ